jgi:peptide/nickel transport system substrate-binding protein
MRFERSGLAIFLFALTACGSGSDDKGGGSGGGEGATPEAGGTVTIVELADISKPMPIIAETSLDNGVTSIMYRSLLESIWEDGELKFVTTDRNPKALARSYEFFGPDSASLRYRMRSDAKWSDGKPITAHDAKWTLETTGNPKVASARQDYTRQIRAMEVEDDTTFVIHFKRRYPEMFFHSNGVGVVPRHVYEGSDLAQIRSHRAVTEPAGGNLVVSGPYMISEWQRGQRLVLVPNPQYQPQPMIQQVVFLTIPEETTRMIELQTGKVDVMPQLPFDKLALVKQSSPNIRLETRKRRFYDYIAYNPRAHPAFADRDVRRALGLAIDVNALLRALNVAEYAEPAGGPYAPIFKLLYDKQAHAPLGFDTVKANQLFDSKGWRRGPDGIRVRDGRKLSFTLTTNAGNQRRADVAQMVQQQWRRVGVDARIQTIETNTFYDRMGKRTFEASIAGWGVGLSADIIDTWKGPGPFNSTSFNNAEVYRLFDQAEAQPTEETAAPYWRQAASLVVAEQPYTWLYYLDEVVGVRDRVKNTRIDTLGTYQNIEEWWIPKSQQGAGTVALAR